MAPSAYGSLLDRRHNAVPVPVDRRAHVEERTTDEGCLVTEIEDETGSYVILEMPEAE